jgi:hypothetical protein
VEGSEESAVNCENQFQSWLCLKGENFMVDEVVSMDIETKIRGDEAWISVARGKQMVGTLTFNRNTICWIPEGSNNPDDSPKIIGMAL